MDEEHCGSGVMEHHLGSKRAYIIIGQGIKSLWVLEYRRINLNRGPSVCRIALGAVQLFDVEVQNVCDSTGPWGCRHIPFKDIWMVKRTVLLSHLPIIIINLILQPKGSSVIYIVGENIMVWWV